jgi:transcriptional regulator with XRE-family HTH domain
MEFIPGELGIQLRRLRQENGLTLRALAEKIGKSESYLSRLENGQINPTLGALKRIGDALGRPLVHLLDNRFPALTTLTKRDKHRRLIISPTLEYEIYSSPNEQISIFKGTLSPGADSGEPYSHQGMETGILLKGSLKITVGDREYLLSEGDSLTYCSEVPHRFENPGEEDAVWIWAVSPPTF